MKIFLRVNGAQQNKSRSVILVMRGIGIALFVTLGRRIRTTKSSKYGQSEVFITVGRTKHNKPIPKRGGVTIIFWSSRHEAVLK